MKNTDNALENVVIIGGGPAGLSAAEYLARAGMEPLVFAGSPPGGQLTLTSEVENYPGHESILGSELIMKMRNQAQKFGARIEDKNVLAVDFSRKNGKPLTLSLSGREVQARAVIIATGAKALWLGLENETKLRGRGVSACATCDGFFFRGKTVAVVGGGDTAMEEANVLAKFAAKVYLIHRRDAFRASRIMQERVLNNPKIEVIYNAIVTDVKGETKVEGIKIKLTNNKDKKEEAERELMVDGLFVAIGHKPDTDIFSKQLDMDEKGYLLTYERKARDIAKLLNGYIAEKKGITMQQCHNLAFERFDLNYNSSTSVGGVFAAGDCVDHVYRQAATAAGMGVAAALDVERYLEGAAIDQNIIEIEQKNT